MPLVVINNDLFLISKRIKDIDKNYFIVFNTEKNRFEVHNSSQPINTFCLVVRDNKLDASLLENVRKTRIENQIKLIREMEESNNALQKANEKKIIDEGIDKFEQLTFKKI